jgi:hypothetical protein
VGRQVGFFAGEKDYRALLEYADAGGLSAATYLIPIGDAARLVLPTEFELPPGQRFFHLVPGGVPPEALRYRPVADGVRQRIDETASAGIEMSPSSRVGDTLLPGRIYFATERRLAWFEATKRAYDRLVRFLGKWDKTEPFGFRVGPAAAAAARAGRMELRMAERDPPLKV